MEDEMKFSVGDRVVVNYKYSWCDGRHGTVKGAYKMPKGEAYYLIGLDETPVPGVTNTFVYEKNLNAE